MSNEPSLYEIRELRALVERNHTDTREDIVDLKAQLGREITSIIGQFSQFVLRDVHNAQMDAFKTQMEALKERVKHLEDESRTARQAARNAMYAAAGSVFASIVVAVFMVVIKGGGK